MRARTFDDVVKTVKPDVDSQYRLRSCDCGSNEVIYAQYITPTDALLWRVVCTDCGAQVDAQTSVQHDAQMAWNRRKCCG